MKLSRITVEPGKMGGQPCIRGMRFPVATLLAMIADGMTESEILEEHPSLEVGDISEALHYASLAVSSRTLPLEIPA